MADGPDQYVPLAEVLRAYTVNAAWKDFADGCQGTIEPGKVADLCVLDLLLLDLDLDPHDITQVGWISRCSTGERSANADARVGCATAWMRQDEGRHSRVRAC